MRPKDRPSDEKKSDPIDVTHETLLTVDDYLQMPEDDLRYELVDGHLELMSPGPSLTHQMICSRLLYLLSNDCGEQYEAVTSPIDVILSRYEVRQPDLVMIRADRLSSIQSRGRIIAAPDLVVEVLSPSTVKRDKVSKSRAYATFGVPEYWVINPVDGTLEQYVLSEGKRFALHDVYSSDEPIVSDTLPCLRLTMNQVMERVRDFSD